MRLFRALVVDDDDKFRELAEEAAKPRSDIEVMTAPTLKQADELVVDHFFHVAFIDLQLDKKAHENVDGQTILKQLSEVRPSCERLLVTQHFSRHRSELFVLFDPETQILRGALDKDEYEHLVPDLLVERADDWLRAPIDIENLDELFAALSERGIPTEAQIRDRAVAPTRDELDYVISQAFGQGAPRAQPEADDLKSIHLQLLPGGKSKSIVAAGRPRDAAGGTGIQCVIKVGPRRDALEEHQRYERYVRFRVSLHRRVELLAVALGDTLGAVCYSFAGQSPEKITDLQGLMDEEQPAARECLERLFADASDWYAEDAYGSDLGGFFRRAYDLRPSRIVKSVDHFVETRAPDFGAHRAGDFLQFSGGKLRLPTEADFGAGRMRDRYGARIVHGDLNASNVVVSDTGEVTLIDFRHTTRGPYALDFAALHASVRLSSPAHRDVARDALRQEHLENKLWKHDWQSDRPWWSPKAPGTPPYWASVAADLMRLAYRNLDGLTRTEYAATCLLYAMRIIRVEQLDDAVRMRLLVWISALCRILDQEDG